jgi:P4 family phage/plasmid primase-like protien
MIMNIADLFNTYVSELPSGDDLEPIDRGDLPPRAGTLHDSFAAALREMPLGSEIKSNFHLEPLQANVPRAPDVAKQLAELRDSLFGDPQRNAARVTEAKESLKKSGEGASALNTLARDVAASLPFIAYRNALYTYSPPIWRRVEGTNFSLLLRENYGDDSLESLYAYNFKELYRQLLTDPQLQKDDYDLSRNPDRLVCRDGLYDITTGRTYPLDSRIFAFTFIDVSSRAIYDSGGEVFERFVATMSNGDDSIRQLLLEVIGVVVSGYMPKKFFVLHGAKNSGKSQFMNLLSLLVGAEQTMSVNNLNNFSHNLYLTATLAGKKLCQYSDLPNTALSASTIAIIKQLTGGDTIEGMQKYQNPFSFTNEATLVIGTNHAIRTSDYDDAFDNRMVTVPFLRSIPQEEQIPNISKLLFEEAGYIVYHASEALRELIDRSWAFTQVDEEYAVAASNPIDPIAQFVETMCELDPDAKTSTQALFDAFTEFCDGNPHMDKAVFARELSARYGLESWRTNSQRGSRGIRLKP